MGRLNSQQLRVRPVFIECSWQCCTEAEGFFSTTVYGGGHDKRHSIKVITPIYMLNVKRSGEIYIGCRYPLDYEHSCDWTRVSVSNFASFQSHRGCSRCSDGDHHILFLFQHRASNAGQTGCAYEFIHSIKAFYCRHKQG